MITKVFVRKINLVNDQICCVSEMNRKRTKWIQVTLATAALIMASVVKAAPHAVHDNTTNSTLNHAVWPPMKHHDIWNDDKSFLNSNQDEFVTENTLPNENIYENIDFSSAQLFNKIIANDIASNVTDFFDKDFKRKSKGKTSRSLDFCSIQFN